MWAVHTDGEKAFKYPAGWTFESVWDGIDYTSPLVEGRSQAAIHVRQVCKLGTTYDLISGYDLESATAADYLDEILNLMRDSAYTEGGPRQTDTINGNPALVQTYTQVHGARDVERLGNTRGIVAVIQKGDYAYYVDMLTREPWWATYEPVFLEALSSFVVLRN